MKKKKKIIENVINDDLDSCSSGEADNESDNESEKRSKKSESD